MADSSSQPLTPPNGDLTLPPSPNPNSPPLLPPSSLLPARKSERKRKIREFPDTSHASRKLPTIWSDSDELTLLNSAREFKARTGAEPKGVSMREFFEEVRGRIGMELDLEKVAYKMRRMKVKWLSLKGDAPKEGHEREVFELSGEVWGNNEGNEKAGHEGEDRNENHKKHEDFYASEPIQTIYADFPTKHPNLTESLKNYQESNKTNFSEVSLEKGLKEMDETRAKELEKKWKKQMENEMRLKMKKHELTKDVYGLLVECVKGHVS